MNGLRIALITFIFQAVSFADDFEKAFCESTLNQYSISSIKRFIGPRFRAELLVNPKRDTWPIDGLSASQRWHYNNFFREGLDGAKFEDLARFRRAQGLNSNFADFFGSAIFTKEPGAFDSLTGIRLQAAAKEIVPQAYLQSQNWTEVTGDIFSSKIWPKLQTSMTARGIPNFDFIVIRPAGILWYRSRVMESNETDRQTVLKLSHLVLSRIWNFLSPQNGTMFVELTKKIFNDPIFKTWVSELNSQNIDAQVYRQPSVLETIYYLRLIKRPESPPNLVGL